MLARSAVRRIVTPVAGAVVLLVGSAVALGVPAAHAVTPPTGSRALPTAEPVVTPEVREVELGASNTTSADPVELLPADVSLDEFARELDAAGLGISEDGNAIVSERSGLPTARELVLAQMAADRFGIVQNPFFDPARAAVVRDGRALVALATGLILRPSYSAATFGMTEVVSMDVLEELRARAGWNLTEAREYAAASFARMLGGYVPVAFRSDEAYAVYLQGARANYISSAT